MLQLSEEKVHAESISWEISPKKEARFFRKTALGLTPDDRINRRRWHGLATASERCGGRYSTINSERARPSTSRISTPSKAAIVGATSVLLTLSRTTPGLIPAPEITKEAPICSLKGE